MGEEEGSSDGEAEKLHFDGGKLNEVCSGASGQIEMVMSARRDHCHLCVRHVMIACHHNHKMSHKNICAVTAAPPIRVNEQSHTYDRKRRAGRKSGRCRGQVREIVC